MNRCREPIPAICAKHVYLLSALLFVVTPVLGAGKCGILTCCGLGEREPKNFDVELSKNVSAMFQVCYNPSVICIYSVPVTVLAIYSDNKKAMDKLYGKIGHTLYMVKKMYLVYELGIVCKRFRKWFKKKKLINKRIGCFLYGMVGNTDPKDYKVAHNLRGVVNNAYLEPVPFYKY